jgi:hypothetical protein
MIFIDLDQINRDRSQHKSTQSSKILNKEVSSSSAGSRCLLASHRLQVAYAMGLWSAKGAAFVARPISEDTITAIH